MDALRSGVKAARAKAEAAKKRRAPKTAQKSATVTAGPAVNVTVHTEQPTPHESHAAPGVSKSSNVEIPQDAIDRAVETVHQDAVVFVRGLLNEAIARNASDLHIEPETDDYRVRFRVDGVLREYTRRPVEEYQAVLNSVKVLADLDIAIHHLPQDGHIELVQQEKQTTPETGKAAFVPNRQYGEETGQSDSTEPEAHQHFFDIRVSVFPSVNGEVLVMRILNRSNALRTVEELGMEPMLLEQLRQLLLSSFGMMLVTGPTGSGKTTTLYSILSELKSDEKNIITLEDPIEFHLDWMRQCEINDERDFTFERAMSSVLRQDPDVLMVGEIRDPATAEYAVRSALVGRIVGSTIHANTAIGTIARLLELGIPRSILAHSINGIIAQRLVRRVCENCKELYTPSKMHLAHLGLAESQGPFFRGRGCSACDNTGFRGRTGLFSVMLFTDELRALIFDQAALAEVQTFAIERGMRTLKMDAAAKVLAGITSIEEAVRTV